MARQAPGGDADQAKALHARLDAAGKPAAAPPLHRLHGLVDLLPDRFASVAVHDIALLRQAIDEVHAEVKDRQAGIQPGDEPEDSLRRMHEILDLGTAVLRGVLADGILLNGFEVIDHVDIIPGLHQHGADEKNTNSGVITAVYDYVFGFRHGKTANRNRAIAAGTFLSGSLRLALGYKGAIFYRMAAGMGDGLHPDVQGAAETRGDVPLLPEGDRPASGRRRHRHRQHRPAGPGDREGRQGL
jgi:hypothetical protein